MKPSELLRPSDLVLGLETADKWQAIQDLEHAPGAVVRYFERLL